MGKKILEWIELHWLITAIITMAIVGSIVIVPILTSRFLLNKKVEENIEWLEIQEIQEKTKEKEQFEIQIEEETNKYKIISKYNKPVTDWTKSEKEEYLQKVEELIQRREENK